MKQWMTHDHFAVLLVHHFLLSQLDDGSIVHPWGDRKVRADLVLDYCISNVLREFAHRLNVCIIFPVSNRARSLGNRVQLVLDPFKSSGIDGFGLGTRSRCMETHSSRAILRLEFFSSSALLPPKSSRPNLARVDSIFPLTPGAI